VRLPFALKGVDVVIYTVFRSLGLKVNVQPVLEDIELDEEEDYYQLVGTGLHHMRLSRRGGYDGEERRSEVHPDSSASSCRAHHIGRLLKRSGLRRGDAVSSG
jgi:hypothetical protein